MHPVRVKFGFLLNADRADWDSCVSGVDGSGKELRALMGMYRQLHVPD